MSGPNCTKQSNYIMATRKLSFTAFASILTTFSLLGTGCDVGYEELDSSSDEVGLDVQSDDDDDAHAQTQDMEIASDSDVEVIAREVLENGVIIEVLGTPGEQGSELVVVGDAKFIADSALLTMSAAAKYKAYTGRDAPEEYGLSEEVSYGCGGKLWNPEVINFYYPISWSGKTCNRIYSDACNTGAVGTIHYVMKKMGEIRKSVVLTPGQCASYTSDSVLAVTYTHKVTPYDGASYWSLFHNTRIL